VELKSALAASRRVSKQLARSEKEAIDLEDLAGQVDMTRAEWEGLSAQLDRLMNTDLGVYAEEVGITPESAAGPSTVGTAMAEAFAKAGAKAPEEIPSAAEGLGEDIVTAYHATPIVPAGPLHTGDVTGREWLGRGVHLTTEAGDEGLLPRMGMRGEGVTTHQVDRSTLFRLGDETVSADLLARVQKATENKAIAKKLDKLLAANRRDLTTKQLYFLLAKATHTGSFTPERVYNAVAFKGADRDEDEGEPEALQGWFHRDRVRA